MHESTEFSNLSKWICFTSEKENISLLSDRDVWTKVSEDSAKRVSDGKILNISGTACVYPIYHTTDGHDMVALGGLPIKTYFVVGDDTIVYRKIKDPDHNGVVEAEDDSLFSCDSEYHRFDQYTLVRPVLIKWKVRE